MSVYFDSMINKIILYRKQQRPKQHAYEMVSNLQNEKPKPAIEMVPDPPENKINVLPAIKDIHDRSETEKDTQNKTPIKNALYEPGIYIYKKINILCSCM